MMGRPVIPWTMDRLERYSEKVPESGCWLWIHGVGSKGYGHTSIDGKHIEAHRLAWLLAKGSDAGRLCVCHRCDIPSCVNPAHLFLGTHRDNVRDSIGKGRARVCRTRSRLSAEDIDFIKNGPMGCKRLMKKYGMSKSHLQRIRRGEKSPKPNAL